MMDNLEKELHPGRRQYLLGWLAGQLQDRELCPEVLWPGETAVLRVVNRRTRTTRFIACVPAPQTRAWAWVWSGGWALVNDPRAVPLIAEAMRS